MTGYGATRGLVLGKFAPLHKGHQLLIETALAETGEVTVIVYQAPETTIVPLKVRADWIRKLYPKVRVIEAASGPVEVGDTPEIRKRHERYVIETLGIDGITHFYSSEFYGRHMSLALGAENRTVDENRKCVPVSATMIREDPFRYRQFLHPTVYRDLITHIVFLGAPSTGKTTLASRLAERYRTVWMPEYGREYWEKHQVDRRLSPEQLLEIAEGHLEREEKLLCEADTYLFTDTNALTTLLFAAYYHGRALPRLVEIAERAATRYDLVFVCGTDIAYEETWDRSGEVNRDVFQEMTLADLGNRGIPYTLLGGDLDSRLLAVSRVIEGYRKY
jgi:NadR type nicotinamide-nucleotide adenylyltransferase